MSSRFLVTGGAGFIGAAVVRDLVARGDEVVVLDSGAAAGYGHLEGLPVRLVQGDIRDREAVAKALTGCTSIVHLAAQTSVPHSIAEPIEDAAVNFDASIALLELARASGAERVVFASSNAVIGGHPPPAHEELVPYPVSPYGAAKAAVEAYLRAYHDAYGLVGVSLRFANAYGPWSSHKKSVVSAFIKAYLAAGPVTIRGTGEQTRDYVHVADVSAVVLACLDAPPDAVANQIFQVGTGVETSLRELAELVFAAGGARVPVEYAPPSPGDVARNVSDVSKARRVLGYTPRVELREGIAQTLDWFRSDSQPRP